MSTDVNRADRIRADLLWRLLVPVAAVVALLADAPQPVTGGLALAGLALAAERLTALRGSGPADQVLVGVGGILVVVVLTGVAMDAIGVRLDPKAWVASLTVLSMVGLGSALVLPERDRSSAAQGDGGSWSTTLRAMPWVAVAVVVTVVALRMSATSLSATDAPPLQMSFGQVSGTKVQVVVSSTDAVGPLEVRTSTAGDDVSYPLFELAAGGSRTTTVSLPRTGRYVISLNYPDQTEPLRTLVLDR